MASALSSTNFCEQRGYTVRICSIDVRRFSNQKSFSQRSFLLMIVFKEFAILVYIGFTVLKLVKFVKDVSSRLWNLKEEKRNQIKFLSLCLAPHKATCYFSFRFHLQVHQIKLAQLLKLLSHASRMPTQTFLMMMIIWGHFLPCCFLCS